MKDCLIQRLVKFERNQTKTVGEVGYYNQHFDIKNSPEIKFGKLSKSTLIRRSNGLASGTI